MSDSARVGLAARVFTLAALTSLAALSGPSFLPGAAATVVVAAVALLVSARSDDLRGAAPLVEGVAVAALAGWAHPHEATVVPYLTIPVLVAALEAGRTRMLQVLVAELAALVLAWTVLVGVPDRGLVATALTWAAVALGLGLLGLVARRPPGPASDVASYRSAVGLIRRLHGLSDRLSAGLDAVAISEQVMALAEARVPSRGALVLVRPGGGALSLLRADAPATAASAAAVEALAECCWDRGEVAVDGARAAVPLATGGDVVAVLVLDGLAVPCRADLEGLRVELAPVAVQLQAALLFDAVRESATRQERARIAREVHDGIAQDVASLGYLVDNLAAGADDDQRAQLAVLRGELTRMVAELRHSVFDLRHEAGPPTGLGESLSSYAQHVSATSAMAVHVTLDEHGPRLSPDVERELVRIGQEAMTNARKHSGADNLWVRCSVRAPYAEIEVRDDGGRPHTPRPDSQGLQIMAERARLAGADLEVVGPERDRAGTRVRVSVGAGDR